MIRRSWTTTAVVAAFALLVAASFFFADAKTDHAVNVARAEAVKEAARADEGICRIAQSNRVRIIAGTEGLLALIRNPSSAETPERAAARAHAIEVLEAQLADAKSPFPEPCTDYSL